MKNGWQKKTLGELIQLISGQHIEAKDYNTESRGMAYLTGPSDFGEINPIISKWTELPKVKAKRGDILITVKGSGVGKINLLDEPEVAISRQLMAIRVTGADPGFIYLFLSSTFDHFQSESTGAAIPGISRDQVLGLRTAIPPLPEQQRIVAILDEAFDGIATAKANAEKNLQSARELFDREIQACFERGGESWVMVRLDEVTNLSRGHNPPKSKFSYEAKPGYVRFYQIRDGGSDDYAVYVPDTPQLHKMNKDDIMMVAYRHVGRAFRGVEGAFNVALCKISNANRNRLHDDYLYHIIPSRFIKGELLKRSERSLIPSMSIEHLKELEIPLPPISVQHRIVESIHRLQTETQRLESIYQQRLTALDELKQSLLHHAFNGDL
ncbi:MAG: restriction endonuclease subunit S [Holophagaceae bacterium]|nr:restriction endonuclease subunit S [Holophagaceae bacterium]